MSVVKEIAKSVRSYASYLVKCKNSKALLRSDSSLKKDRIDTHFIMPNLIGPVPHVDIRYRAFDDALEQKTDFQFIVLDNNFGNFRILEDRNVHFRWFEELTLGCGCKLFYIMKMSPINNIDNIYYYYY